MKVKIKRTHPDAQLPKKAYESDFCYDVVAVSEEEVAPNVWKYGLGIALQIERDGEFVSRVCVGQSVEYMDIDFKNSRFNIGITLRPRSSIYKTGMVLSNSIGTGDENYTGEYSAIFYHVMPNMPRYRVGDRVAQCHLDFTLPIEFVDVEELNETDRGDGAYGSSGK